MSSQPKSPAKRKISPRGRGTHPKSSKEDSQQSSVADDARVTRSRSKPRHSQDVEQSTYKSPAKTQVQCKVCNWTGKSLGHHLNKQPQCAAHYDMGALEAEAKQRHRDQKVARSRARYPEESPRKRAAARENYKMRKAMKNLNLDQAKREEQQEITSSQPQTPKKENTVCNGCGKDFQNIMTHLKATEECAALYDMDDMQAKSDAKIYDMVRPIFATASQNYALVSKFIVILMLSW